VTQGAKPAIYHFGGIMKLSEYINRTEVDSARLEGLLRQVPQKPQLKHLSTDKIWATIRRNHIHLIMPYGDNTPWWSGRVLDADDIVHSIQIVYEGHDFEAGYASCFCWTCNRYCEALAAAVILHIARRDPPQPKLDHLTRCPICMGQL
jgi:hypothetical protein